MMNVKQVLDYYGTKREAAYSLGLHENTITNWENKGNIPLWSQYAISHLTKNKLKADAN